MRIIRKAPQNIVKDKQKSQILLLNCILCMARVGLMASSYILLVANFDLNALNSAIVTIALQGFAVFSKLIANYLFSRFTIRRIQIVGSFIGTFSAFGMIFTRNFYLFCIFILIASLAKISREITSTNNYLFCFYQIIRKKV